MLSHTNITFLCFLLKIYAFFLIFFFFSLNILWLLEAGMFFFFFHVRCCYMLKIQNEDF